MARTTQPIIKVSRIHKIISFLFVFSIILHLLFTMPLFLRIKVKKSKKLVQRPQSIARNTNLPSKSRKNLKMPSTWWWCWLYWLWSSYRSPSLIMKCIKRKLRFCQKITETNNGVRMIPPPKPSKLPRRDTYTD